MWKGTEPSLERVEDYVDWFWFIIRYLLICISTSVKSVYWDN